LLEDKNGWVSMLKDERVNELSRIIHIYNKYSNIDGLKLQFERYMSEKWTQFMKKATAEADRLPNPQFSKLYAIRKIF
jgi:hypothetical protein